MPLNETTTALAARRQLTTKFCEVLAETSPSKHVTDAVEVPAPVLGPTVHFQVTLPEASATCTTKPCAFDTVPEAYLTLGVHVAPGEVTATIVASALGATEAGRLVIVTESFAVGAVAMGVAGGEVTCAVGAAVVAGFVGAEVARAVGAAVGVGVVGEATSAML